MRQISRQLVSRELRYAREDVDVFNEIVWTKKIEEKETRWLTILRHISGSWVDTGVPNTTTNYVFQLIIAFCRATKVYTAVLVTRYRTTTRALITLCPSKRRDKVPAPKKQPASSSLSSVDSTTAIEIIVARGWPRRK